MGEIHRFGRPNLRRLVHVGGARTALFTAAILLLTLVVRAPHADAQGPELRFEAASVKENVSGDASGYASISLSASEFQSSEPVKGSVTLRNIQLCNLIARAFELSGPMQQYGLFNGLAGDGICAPGQSGSTGLLARRFDVVARPAEGSRPADVFAMLRSLLADRFKLKMRRESRPLPVYALTVVRPGQLGTGLRPSTVDCVERARRGDPRPAPDQDPCLSRLNNREVLGRSAGSPTALVRAVQNGVDRLVVDATGLSGTYEWEFSYARVPDHPSLPTIYTAIREQLGLRLEPRTMPVDAWVIEHIEAPSPD